MARKLLLVALLAVTMLPIVSRLSHAYYSGIDVSHWQGTIDWAQVRSSGVSFAFMKATQGVDYQDPTFTTNIQAAHANGILAGPYHFATPYTDGINDAAAEADWFAANVGSYLQRGYLRPVVDLEQGGSLGSTVLSAWVCTFENRFKQVTGVEPIIYCNTNYAANYLNSTVSNYTLWIANWTYDTTKQPGTGVFPGWAFWQWSNKTTVPGISGNVDGDLCPFDPMAYSIPLPGDANTDGAVGIGDMSILLANYNKTGMAWSQGELTGDGAVGIDDMSRLLANYNRSVTAAATLVPEPSSWLLIAVVTLVFGVSRKRGFRG